MTLKIIFMTVMEKITENTKINSMKRIMTLKVTTLTMIMMKMRTMKIRLRQ